MVSASIHAFKPDEQKVSPNTYLEKQLTVKRAHLVEKKSPELEIDSVAKKLLQRFRSQPVELQIVDELNKNSEGFLNHIHQRLADTIQPLSVSEAGELMLPLSLIKDEQALTVLLQVAERFNDNVRISQQVLLMLRELPVTETVLAYVDDLLKARRNSPVLIRSALLYYVAVKHEAGMRWAAYYRSPGIDPQLRFAGLTLAALLSQDDQVTRWILKELKAKPAIPTYQHYYLLQALSANVTEAEFNQLLKSFTAAPVVVKEFQRVRDFNKATGAAKHKLAEFMLTSAYSNQQQTALEYYLNNHKVMDIWPGLKQSKRLSVIRLSHKLGVPILPVADSGHDFTLEHMTYIGFILLIVLVALSVYHFALRREHTVPDKTE